jgi:hypothetical protein
MGQVHLCVTGINNAINEAVKAVLNLHNGDVLCLGGSELHFYPKNGFMKEYWIANNDGGLKSIAFPLIGKKNM